MLFLDLKNGGKFGNDMVGLVVSKTNRDKLAMKYARKLLMYSQAMDLNFYRLWVNFEDRVRLDRWQMGYLASKNIKKIWWYLNIWGLGTWYWEVDKIDHLTTIN